MPKGSLKNWIDAARKGKLKEVGRNQKPLRDLKLELAKTKRELAETSYAMNERMSQNLVMQALFQAMAAKRPGKGPIHHSDRGSQ